MFSPAWNYATTGTTRRAHGQMAELEVAARIIDEIDEAIKKLARPRGGRPIEEL